METKEKTGKRRPAPTGRKPAAAGRKPAPAGRKPVASGRKAPVKSSAWKINQMKASVRAKNGSDRARREAAARAAKIKSLKQEVQNKPKRRVSRPKAPMQPVVYTQPKVFNRTRLIVQLLTIVVSVFAMVLCLSIFFRVETVTVSGNKAYSAWAVREASGIEDGDYLLTFSKSRACAKIKAGLPYVDTVRIGIKLPNTVNIVIEEIDVVYAIQDQNGIWWLMTSGGRIMEQTDAVGAADHTKVLGVAVLNPEKDAQATAFQPLDQSAQTTEATQQDPEASTPTPLIVTEQQKLNAALNILQALELNEVVGEAASVDVSDLSRIMLWYGTRYQVNLGDTGNMDYKISCLKYTVSSLSDYDSGELDISFTTWPDKVTYTPFD